MTLILKLDLDMVKMYLHSKNEVSMSRGSKVIAWTDRNTDTQTHRQIHRQTHRHNRKHYLLAHASGNKHVYFLLLEIHLKLLYAMGISVRSSNELVNQFVLLLRLTDLVQFS